MTTATPDFRALAIQALADNADLYPPAGWAAEFDAMHDDIPAWALDGKPHEVYLRAARSGRRAPSDGAAPAYSALFWNQVFDWLRLHPEAPEIAAKVAEIRDAWVHRDEWPEDWAPYQRMIDEAAVEVPY